MSNTQQNTSNKEAKKPTVILNLFQNLKNKWKVITVILLILITILGVLVYLPFTNNKPVERIIWEWRNTGTFSSDRVTKGDYDGYIAVRNYNFTQTKFDLFKPVYSFVAQVKGELNEGTREQFTIEVRTIYLQRTGIDSWKVTDYRNNEIRGLTLQEATTLATQHDLTTNFPNKSNYKITNYPPLTPEQIEANRKVREESETRKQQSSLDYEAKNKAILDLLEKGASPKEILPAVKEFYKDLKVGYDSYQEYLEKMKQAELEYSKTGKTQDLEMFKTTVLGITFTFNPQGQERDIEELKNLTEGYIKGIKDLENCTKPTAKECV